MITNSLKQYEGPQLINFEIVLKSDETHYIICTTEEGSNINIELLSISKGRGESGFKLIRDIYVNILKRLEKTGCYRLLKYYNYGVVGWTTVYKFKDLPIFIYPASDTRDHY